MTLESGFLRIKKDKHVFKRMWDCEKGDDNRETLWGQVQMNEQGK